MSFSTSAKHSNALSTIGRSRLVVMSSAMPDRLRALVIVGAGTGLRPGELFGLQVRHINFLRRTVTVEQQVQQTASLAVYVARPKTNSSYRTVPVGQVVIETLAEHLRAYPRGA